VERTRVMQPSVLMKAVAACLLFQPQRAARDYRGILSEYAKTIFLDEHDGNYPRLLNWSIGALATQSEA
ncbi:MAG: hypothetical protein ACREDP_13770, partial [Bradyrhizobium sp.]